MNTVEEDVSPEYFFVATLSLYKNVTDAKLASCKTARNLAKHRRFYKGSLRNIPGWHPFCYTYSHRNSKIDFLAYALLAHQRNSLYFCRKEGPARGGRIPCDLLAHQRNLLYICRKEGPARGGRIPYDLLAHQRNSLYHKSLAFLTVFLYYLLQR